MEDKLIYTLRIADDTLVLAHQLGAYCSYAPFLEEDLAIANTSLDLIGQAESVYAEIDRASQGEFTERTLVYRRTAEQFLNHQLVEQPNVDFSHIMVRQFFMDNYNFHVYSKLVQSKDPFLFAFANKSLKEVTYHLRRSSEWIIRLGDGTKEAHDKTQRAIDTLFPFTAALFVMDEVDMRLLRSGISVDLEEVKTGWLNKLVEIFYIAGLGVPTDYTPITDGRNGKHSKNLTAILDEMQALHRQEPEAIWL